MRRMIIMLALWASLPLVVGDRQEAVDKCKLLTRPNQYQQEVLSPFELVSAIQTGGDSISGDLISLPPDRLLNDNWPPMMLDRQINVSTNVTIGAETSSKHWYGGDKSHCLDSDRWCSSETTLTAKAPRRLLNVMEGAHGPRPPCVHLGVACAYAYTSSHSTVS